MGGEAAQKAKAEGNAAFSAGRYDEAIGHFTKSIEHDPTDHVLYSNRSGAHAMAEQYSKALEDSEECIKINPAWPKGYSRKGLALFKLGRTNDAMDAYQKGLDIDPNNEQLKEAMSHARQGLLFGALQTNLNVKISKMLLVPKYKRYAQEDPKYEEKLLSAAMESLFSRSNPLGAMNPQNADARIEEGLNEILRGSSDEEDEERERRGAAVSASQLKKREEEAKKRAEEERLAAKSAEEKESDKIKQEGNNAYKKRNFEEALALYDKAIELNPKDILIFNNKAAVYLEMGKYDECIGQCEKAVAKRYEVKADFSVVAKVFNRMAVCYTRQKEYQKAIDMYEKSLLEDNNRHTRAALKEVGNIKDNADKEAYIDPVKSEEHKQKGNEFYKAKDYVNAKKEYDESIRRNGNDAKLYSNRAAAYTSLMEYPSALKDVEKAIEIDPTFVKAWSRKGTIHFFMKAYSKAQEAYRRGLQIEPDNAECRQGLEQTINRILETQRTSEVDEDQVKQAMADPEIQSILSDPQFRLILEQISQNPASLQEALKEPKIAEGLQKLMSAGIVRFQ